MFDRTVHGIILGAVLVAAPLLFGSGSVVAQALEIRNGDDVGSGSAFRRGADCLVLTAEHVVRDATRVKVLDRSGASASGEVVHVDDQNDVALVALDDKAEVACTERWSDGAWLASERFRPAHEFYFIRQDPGGREAVVNLRWAGGNDTQFTLSHVDKMRVRASDSGSLAYVGERPAGIVLNVDTGSDRVTVLRLDAIDRLLGSRFESAPDGLLVALDEVVHEGRAKPSWTSYISTWFGSGDAPSLVAVDDPRASCRVRVEVLAMDHKTIANPEVDRAREDLAGCRTGLLTRNSSKLISACESEARSRIKQLPARVEVTSVQMQIRATGSDGITQQGLKSFQYGHPSGRGVSRADVELNVLKSSFAELAPASLRAAGCMRGISDTGAKKKRSGVQWPWQRKERDAD